jgi:hypothetical protein
MNRKSKYLIGFISLNILALFILIFYLSKYHTISNNSLLQKNLFVSILGLPDLAITTEAMYIRHRSLTTTFELFKDSPELREYFPSSFTYNYSNVVKNTPSKITNEN